jgi:hypothetical protein
MSSPSRRGRAACHRRPTAKSSRREEAEARQPRRCVELPAGPEYAALVAALLHLEAACGFSAGVPSQREIRALRSTRRYRDLGAHLPQWPEEGLSA